MRLHVAALQIRPAAATDLPELYALARGAFVHDAFSADLLREKLFTIPRAGETSAAVLLAHADGRLAAFMQSLVRESAAKAWIGLFAVAPDVRRRGLARMLYEQIAQSWPSTIAEVEALAIPGNYFTPGLDPRYTAAHCFLERLGFERFRDCVNLRAPLRAPWSLAADEQRLAADGFVIRRAAPDDRGRLNAFFAADFGADWRYEAGLALDVDPPALHLALLEDRLVAFAAHSTQNREWGFFGPMGTTPAARGRGIGRVLLLRCLNDLLAAGHGSAVIPWVGPIGFYQEHCAADVERVFWRYRLKLT